MTREERKIVNGLLERDNRITKLFFFTKCRPMFHNMIHNIYRDKGDYDELVNDFYLYLMENDGKRLRSFGNDDTEDNDQSTSYALIMWIKKAAWRFFAHKAEREQSVEEQRKFVIDDDGREMDVDIEDRDFKDPGLTIDANTFFDMIKLERDREVLKKYFIEDLEPDVISEELGISKDNLYNIKKRALNRLQQAARHATSEESLCCIICEQYILDIFGIHKSLDALRDLSEKKGLLTETGVKIENIGLLCRDYNLMVSSCYNGTLNDMAESLRIGHQVIAAVDGGELIGNPLEEEIEDAFGVKVSDHCVVVLAVEDESVTLYDPAFGYTPLMVSNDHFLDAWEDSGYYYVSINKF